MYSWRRAVTFQRFAKTF